MGLFHLSLGRTPYYIVASSPWPISVAVRVWGMAFGFVIWVWGKEGVFTEYGGLDLILLRVARLILTLGQWWRDVRRERRAGFHTRYVEKAIWDGFILFLASEVIFFFSLFWALGHISLAPDIRVNCAWPPIGIRTINPWKVPALGTAILLRSGARIKYAHAAVKVSRKKEVVVGMLVTIMFAVTFMCLQAYEYYWASFRISDRVFGGCFYILTGFHGMHVTFGFGFLRVTLCRVVKNHFTPKKHVVFKMCRWYWHFVDWVWVGVYFILYVWRF